MFLVDVYSAPKEEIHMCTINAPRISSNPGPRGESTITFLSGYSMKQTTDDVL